MKQSQSPKGFFNFFHNKQTNFIETLKNLVRPYEDEDDEVSDFEERDLEDVITQFFDLKLSNLLFILVFMLSFLGAKMANPDDIVFSSLLRIVCSLIAAVDTVYYFLAARKWKRIWNYLSAHLFGGLIFRFVVSAAILAIIILLNFLIITVLIFVLLPGFPLFEFSPLQLLRQYLWPLSALGLLYGCPLGFALSFEEWSIDSSIDEVLDDVNNIADDYDRITAQLSQEPANEAKISETTIGTGPISDQRIPLQPGIQLIGDQCYTIVGDPLGRGGSSIVYKAETVECANSGAGTNNQNRTWIIKEFYPAALIDHIERVEGDLLKVSNDKEAAFETLRSHFMSGYEKHISLQEKFPNQMIHVRTHFTANGTDYIVMDISNGNTLDKLPPPKSVHDAAEWMISLCHALIPYHQNGLLYLDIKPQNIYKYENENRIVLFDFDAVQSIEELRSSTSPLSISKGWAARELMTGARGSISQATDIYPIGQVLYWLITGKRSPSVLLSQKDYRKASRLCYGMNDLAEERLEKIFQFTLSSTPSGRYSSVVHLIQDLEELCKYTEAGYGDLQAGLAESTSQIIDNQESTKEDILRHMKRASLLRTLLIIGATIIWGVMIVIVTRYSTAQLLQKFMLIP